MLNLGFQTENPEIAKETQILRQVFWTETQILIVIPSHSTEVMPLGDVDAMVAIVTYQVCPTQ